MRNYDCEYTEVGLAVCIAKAALSTVFAIRGCVRTGSNVANFCQLLIDDVELLYNKYVQAAITRRVKVNKALIFPPYHVSRMGLVDENRPFAVFSLTFQERMLATSITYVSLVKIS